MKDFEVIKASDLDEATTEETALIGFDTTTNEPFKHSVTGNIETRIAVNESDISTAQSDISDLETNKVNTSDIVTDLTTDDDTKVLSAKQGKTLKDLVDVNTPAGVIEMYGGSSAPSGWLMCTGQAVSRTTYASLFTAIGTAFGVGDGSTTFNVPDFQGRSPKGVGTSSGGSDVTHVAETIVLATKYNDKMQGHRHELHTAGGGTQDAVMMVGADGGFSSKISSGSSATTTNYLTVRSPNTDTVNGTPRTGTTTTGKTLGINFIIKT